MIIKKCGTYEELSDIAAKIVAEQLEAKPDSVLGLPTGSTPLGMYARLVAMYEKGDIDFSKVTTFNLDEYYPISKDNGDSYYQYMLQNLYSKVNLSPGKTNIPNGEAEDWQSECSSYEEKIDACGGIDLLIAGVGVNGHIAFNEPAEFLSGKTHLVSLEPSTLSVNSAFFSGDMPQKALSMGMGTILKAKKLLVIASGSSKKNVIDTVAKGLVTTQMPATFFNLHPDVTILDGSY